jgi:RecA/RadA recombinase
MSSKWLSKLSADFGMAASQLKTLLPPVLPSRSPSLNWALDIGGFQPGKVYVPYGPESAGKSMLVMMAIADFQKRDPEAIFVWFDAEFSFNLPLFVKVGGDPERLYLRRSNDPEKIFDYMKTEMKELLQDGCPIRGFVIDSIKSILYPKEMNAKKTTDQKMGGTGASYLPTALKWVVPIVAEFNLLAFLIQQVTMEIDPMKALRNPYVITEGKALKHAADAMLEITKLDTKAGVLESGKALSGSDHQVGHVIRVKVKKNRLGRPARVAQFSYHYDKGVINTGEELFELGKTLGLIFHPVSENTGKPNAMYWAFGKHPAIKGEDNMKQFVVNSKEVQDELMKACFSHQDSTEIKVDADGVVIEDIEDELSGVSLDNED